MFYFDIGHAQGKRYKKYFKERIYKYCNYDCNAYSDNCTMKHEKEWYTCDRCGEEIDMLPSQQHILRRKIASPTELKMMCDEKYGYLGDTHLITEDVISVTIVETHDVKTRRFDLCPRCRKDFERFMRNENTN